MYELFDMYEAFDEDAELLLRSEDLEEIKEAAAERDEDTDGECDLVVYKDGIQVKDWWI